VIFDHPYNAESVLFAEGSRVRRFGAQVCRFGVVISVVLRSVMIRA